MLKKLEPDILEFIKTSRSLKSQVEIMYKLKMSAQEEELINKALLELTETINNYLKGKI